MKTFPASFLFAARVAIFALAASTGHAAMAQGMAFAPDCAPRLSGLQQRLFDKADEGPSALRDFMFIRRGILQLDIYETGTWADSVKEGRAACMKQLARTLTVPEAPTQMATAAASAPSR